MSATMPARNFVNRQPDYVQETALPHAIVDRSRIKRALVNTLEAVLAEEHVSNKPSIYTGMHFDPNIIRVFYLKSILDGEEPPIITSPKRFASLRR
jgi:hypothetical protein